MRARDCSPSSTTSLVTNLAFWPPGGHRRVELRLEIRERRVGGLIPLGLSVFVVQGLTMSRSNVAKYPSAIWDEISGPAGSYLSGPFKIVHHTTEGSS